VSKAKTSIAVIAALAFAMLAHGCTKRPKGRPETEAQASAPAKQELTASAAKKTPPAAVRVKVPVTGAEPHKGPAIAPLTMVVFSDFECPFCGRAQPILRELEQSYGPRLSIVWRNLPLDFHSHAKLAAEAAMEAFAQGKDEKFWAMHDKLMANQKALGQKDLERYAKELGLDLKRFRGALDQHTHAQAVDDDVQLARRLGVTGTPVFFVNGRPLQGAPAVPMFKALLDDELERVQEQLAKGVAPADLYSALTANGQESATFGTKPPRRSPVEPTVYNVPVSSEDPQRGPGDALVTAVVFGDFECEYTEKALAALAPLEKKYGKDLRLVWKNQPMQQLHEHARDAATVAMLAFAKGGSELFWQAGELLFANRTALDQQNLINYGQQMGLDAAELKTALAEERFKVKVDADKQLSRRVDFTPTTPMITVNGRYVRGAQSTRIYELLIDEELAKAQGSLAQGVARDRIYEAAIKDGKVAPYEIAPGTESADARKIHELPVPAGAASKGDLNAKVVIQEFADFECPFCQKAEAPLQKLLAAHPDTIRLVWRNQPLVMHPHALLAAEAAQEALAQGGNDKFWAYHELLFANQAALERADLERYAQKLGLNMTKFREALDKGHHRAEINADLAAAESIGEQVGTPAFLVNGMLVAGAQAFEIFETAYQRGLTRHATATAEAAKKTGASGAAGAH
jgi:protein-disulfide isomerase